MVCITLSPGFPANYPHNRDCVWTLRTMPGKRIQFLFATMKLETHTNCSFDYLEIFNGDAVEGIDIFSVNSRIPSFKYEKKNHLVKNNFISPTGFLSPHGPHESLEQVHWSAAGKANLA